jgi:hypothetical protein
VLFTVMTTVGTGLIVAITVGMIFACVTGPGLKPEAVRVLRATCVTTEGAIQVRCTRDSGSIALTELVLKCMGGPPSPGTPPICRPGPDPNPVMVCWLGGACPDAVWCQKGSPVLPRTVGNEACTG